MSLLEASTLCITQHCLAKLESATVTVTWIKSMQHVRCFVKLMCNVQSMHGEQGSTGLISVWRDAMITTNATCSDAVAPSNSLYCHFRTHLSSYLEQAHHTMLAMFISQGLVQPQKNHTNFATHCQHRPTTTLPCHEHCPPCSTIHNPPLQPACSPRVRTLESNCTQLLIAGSLTGELLAQVKLLEVFNLIT